LSFKEESEIQRGYLGYSFTGLPLDGSESNAKPQTAQAGIPVRAEAARGLESVTAPRVLLIDIENSPNLAYVWDVWNQNIRPQMLVETKEILCFAFKWLGEEGVFAYSQFYDGRKGMLEHLWRVMDEADIVVDYNGSRHDILHINQDLLKAGYGPPSPYKHIDLFKTIKRKFNFTYMTLSHVCEQLGLSSKLDAGGFETWLGCMQSDPDSWDKLIEYNLGDIPPLEELYLRLRPWISPHPNMSLYSGEFRCTYCGSMNVQRRGWKYTSAGRFRQIMCNDCGGWSRLAKREATTNIRQTD
jgi:hypothetical protein